MSWPQTKGDKVFAGFLILCALWAVGAWSDNNARYRCEEVLEEFQQSIYDNFGRGLWERLYNPVSSARSHCRGKPFKLREALLGK